jgi:hypothetical protein
LFLPDLSKQTANQLRARSNGEDGVVGMMDEVYIFSRALSGAEILDLYNTSL